LLRDFTESFALGSPSYIWVGYRTNCFRSPHVVKWYASRALASFPPEVLELAIFAIRIAIVGASGMIT
jgi:hypothetical protein